MVYCRVYTNYESAEMYRTVFHNIFDSMKARIGKLIKWSHIHGEGLKYVVIDMDSK
jgi:hypothetical protein